MRIKIYIYILCTILIESCVAQNKINSECYEHVTAELWIPNGDYSKIENDSVLTLVFEENFSDTVRIKIDEKIIVKKYIKTIKQLGVSMEQVRIDKNLIQKNALHIIIGRKCFSTSFDLQRSFLYLTFEHERLEIDMSDYKRKYR